MPQSPDLFVTVSLPSGLHRVPRAIAERGGWRIIDAPPRKRRQRERYPKPRVDLGAATPTHKPGTAPGETPRSQE